MRRICGITLVLVIVLQGATAAPVPETPPLGGLGHGVARVLRANDSRVREELKLSESQVKQIERLNAEWEQALSSLQQTPRGGEEAKKKFKEASDLNKVHAEAYVKILTKKQLRRTEQIYLQQLSVSSAFLLPQVTTVLKFTEKQKEEIALIRRESNQERLGKGGGRGGEAARQERSQSRARQDEKLLNVLTPGQRAKWKQLLGETFKPEARRSDGPSLSK